MRSVISLRDRSIVSGFAYFEIALQVPAAIAAVRSSSPSGSVKNTSRVETLLGFRNGEDLGLRQVRQRVSKKRNVGCQIPNCFEAACSAATRLNNFEVACAANIDFNPWRTIGCRCATTNRMQRVNVPWTTDTSNIGLTSPALRGALVLLLSRRKV